MGMEGKEKEKRNEKRVLLLLLIPITVLFYHPMFYIFPASRQPRSYL